MSDGGRQELKDLRRQVHTVFDTLWMEAHMTRDQAYQWATEVLEQPETIHIGFLTAEQCKTLLMEALKKKGFKVSRDRTNSRTSRNAHSPSAD